MGLISVFDSIDWDDSCRLALMTKKKLDQAIQIYENMQEPNVSDIHELSSSSLFDQPTPKRLRFSFGDIHENMCMML